MNMQKLLIERNLKYNPDEKIVNSIKESLIKTEGYCPCVPKSFRNEDTICPCKEVRTENKCRCGLFINS